MHAFITNTDVDPVPVKIVGTAPGGGGAVTIADGADQAMGAKADAAATTDSGAFSLIALAKRALGNWTMLLTRIPSQSTGAVPVETIKQALMARQLAAAASSGLSANTALTTTCRRVSIYARGADIRYVIGSTAQTATSASHFIGAGERLDLAVPATPNIAVLGATLTAGTLEVTELS